MIKGYADMFGFDPPFNSTSLKYHTIESGISGKPSVSWISYTNGVPSITSCSLAVWKRTGRTNKNNKKNLADQ